MPVSGSLAQRPTRRLSTNIGIAHRADTVADGDKVTEDSGCPCPCVLVGASLALVARAANRRAVGLNGLGHFSRPLVVA